MKKAADFVPDIYQQPVRDYIGRDLSGSLEQVDFIPEFNLRIWYNNQNDGYALHQHNAMEVLIPVENNYIVVVNEKKYVLNVGDILFIPRYMLHEILPQEQGIRFVYLFNTEFLKVLHDVKILGPAFLEPYLISAHSHAGIRDQVYSCFMQMNSLYFSNGVLLESAIFSILMRVLSIVGTEHFNRLSISMDSTTRSSKKSEYYGKFSALLLYIDSHFEEDLTLDQMAAFVGFSKFHFSRLFKDYTNTTFYDYLSHKRIQEAQAMLAGNKSITDIAFQTGFNNLTTFSRCFKKYTNCSPSEYRNKFAPEKAL